MLGRKGRRVNQKQRMLGFMQRRGDSQEVLDADGFVPFANERDKGTGALLSQSFDRRPGQRTTMEQYSTAGEGTAKAKLGTGLRDSHEEPGVTSGAHLMKGSNKKVGLPSLYQTQKILQQLNQRHKDKANVNL